MMYVHAEKFTNYSDFEPQYHATLSNPENVSEKTKCIVSCPRLIEKRMKIHAYCAQANSTHHSVFENILLLTVSWFPDVKGVFHDDE